MIFIGNALGIMEQELNDVLHCTQQTADSSGTNALLTDILPTMRQRDLPHDAMTPKNQNASPSNFFHLSRFNGYTHSSHTLFS